MLSLFTGYSICSLFPLLSIQGILGQPCTTDPDCTSVPNAHCSAGTCACMSGFTDSSGTCISSGKYVFPLPINSNTFLMVKHTFLCLRLKKNICVHQRELHRQTTHHLNLFISSRQMPQPTSKDKISRLVHVAKYAWHINLVTTQVV